MSEFWPRVHGMNWLTILSCDIADILASRAWDE